MIEWLKDKGQSFKTNPAVQSYQNNTIYTLVNENKCISIKNSILECAASRAQKRRKNPPRTRTMKTTKWTTCPCSRSKRMCRAGFQSARRCKANLTSRPRSSPAWCPRPSSRKSASSRDSRRRLCSRRWMIRSGDIVVDAMEEKRFR